MPKVDDMTPNPAILRWARINSGFSDQQILAEVGKHWKSSNTNLLSDWEKGVKKPTISQLIFLSEKYKRPLALFFSAVVPEEAGIPPEFRRLAMKGDVKLGSKVMFAIRSARKFQDRLETIAEELGRDISFKGPLIRQKTSSVTATAQLISELTGYTSEKIREFATPAQVFQYIRTQFENLNCFTIKSSFEDAFDIDEARAFSMVDREPFIIVISNSDSPSGRLFSLIHEFTHVLLRNNSIDNGQVGKLGKGIPIVERYCNAVAAEFLVPSTSLSSNFKRQSGDIDLFQKVQKLSLAFKVSAQVITIRLKELSFITESEERTLYQLISKFKKSKANGGIRVPVRDTIYRFGSSYINLLTEAHQRQIISYSDLSSFLKLKIKHLPDLLHQFGYVA